MGVTMTSVIKGIEKQYGGDVVQKKSIKNVPRLLTGIYPFDYYTGGWPKGRFSLLWGGESSGKTELVYKTIANANKIEPDKTHVLMDIEQTHTDGWARSLGVDTSKLYVIQPDCIEHATGMLEQVLRAEDIGVIAVDSIAAMMALTEVEKDASQDIVAAAARAMNRLSKKILDSFKLARLEERDPVVIFVNQIRHKIGVMYGSPDVWSGGKALTFFSSMTIKLYGKKVEAEASTKFPTKLQVGVTVQKWKVPILSPKFEMVLNQLPDDNGIIGTCDFMGDMKNHLIDFGYLAKKKNQWWFNNHLYKTQKEILAKIESDPVLRNNLQKSLINKALSNMGVQMGDNS